MESSDKTSIAQKKRGCNYTYIEKQELLDIVKRYIHIIENKATNGAILKEKQAAWVAIAEDYNSRATSGRRTWVQLRHLYDNMKQRTKKNVAKENRQQFYEKENLIKDAKERASYDKKQMIQTGGGSYKTVLTETDAKMLALVAPQIRPICNPYDDAAQYFGDEVELNEEPEISQELSELPNSVEIEILNIDQSSQGYEAETNIPVDEPSTSHSDQIGNKTLNTKVIIQKKKLKPKRSNDIKTEYFKTKLCNARLERKFMREKHAMEMELLKLKLRKFK